MAVPRGDAVALARALIQIDSRNPTLASDSPGEGDCARALASILDDWGFTVQLIDGAPGRPNVVARIGPADAPALMLNGHLDVVGVEGMVHEPFAAEVRGNRIYGRGSADMKGGVASRWVVVTVGSPNLFTMSGQVIDNNGDPVQGVRVHNGRQGAAYQYSFTDSDASRTPAT